jgi:hypothetical protein
MPKLRTSRRVALVEVSAELLMDVLMVSRDAFASKTYISEIVEASVSPDLQEISGPPMTWYGALKEARLIEVRSTSVEGMFQLMIESPQLREVPSGHRMPILQLTYRKITYRKESRPWPDSL